MTKQQPAEVRRKRILDAATSLLIKGGLGAASMDAVAAAAGIAKGTVYLYFPSRAELLASLRRRYAENLARRAASILSGRVSDTALLVEAYQALVAELTTYLLANRRLHHVLFQEAGVSEEETMEPLRDLIRASLRQAMGQGAIDLMDPDVLMRFLVDGMHGAVVPLFHDRPADRRRTVIEIQEVIRRVLVPSRNLNLELKAPPQVEAIEAGNVPAVRSSQSRSIGTGRSP